MTRGEGDKAMKHFYILSLKWSKKKDKVITWWRPNNAGYCLRMDWAGKYTQAHVDEHQSYYNDGKSTIAVPCDVVDKLVEDNTVSWGHLKKLIKEYGKKKEGGK